jgi:hypothetical protein
MALVTELSTLFNPSPSALAPHPPVSELSTPLLGIQVKGIVVPPLDVAIARAGAA